MTGPPRTALVHDWLTGMRGGEKVLEALLPLLPDAPIFTLFHIQGSVSREIESRSIHTSFLQRAPGARRHYRRYLPLFPAAVEDFDLSGFPRVVSTSHCVAKGVIPPPDAYHVCYCHTPMRYAWDQEHAYFPKRRGIVPRIRGAILSRLRAWDVASSPRVDLFVANSRFVAQRIRRYYGRRAEVVHPPVDVEFFAADSSDDSSENPAQGSPPYALAVSALAPYKRLEIAIEACERLKLSLRIVGTGPETRRLRSLAGEHTRFLGRVDGDELRRLYRGARCFLQPGVEDFGIAPVEALAAGTPVVAAGRGGVLDIVDDGVHGVLYDSEGGADALGAAIDKLDEIRFNMLNLKERAENFSTNCFHRRFQAVLDSEASDLGKLDS